MLAASTTSGIEVVVRTLFNAEESRYLGRPFFEYNITIRNDSSGTVQLLYRSWLITDSLGQKRSVFGPGVVGEQPILRPGESFTYRSGCDFETGIGMMEGKYIFRDIHTNRTFPVRIPRMTMMLPAFLN
ncbi:MAG: Co2+/Mg2+ efflux protein ApaG [Flavobacteriales bacterium]|nr:Co2+/Mg2+ efflux protein ApaG [Flavobacteriales bacterium]MCX7768754.1 Co2+/Mg2+ efflux protein ApaG [Flavobacteriales bacterium]MDW8409913.1 Co2+/Mg2+ efflux protein ApaG [Flavobacteriales bacterium]